MNLKLIAYGIALVAILGGLFGVWYAGDRHGQGIVQARFTAYRAAENAKIVQIQAADAKNQAILQQQIEQEGQDYANTLQNTRNRYAAALERLRNTSAANGPGSVSRASQTLCGGNAAARANALSEKLAADLGLIRAAQEQTDQLEACQAYIRVTE